MNYKCYIMIELTFLKELMLMRQANQKSVILVFFRLNLDLDYFLGLNFNHMYAMAVMIYWRCL